MTTTALSGRRCPNAAYAANMRRVPQHEQPEDEQVVADCDRRSRWSSMMRSVQARGPPRVAVNWKSDADGAAASRHAAPTRSGTISAAKIAPMR